jgi:hypothetical protein
LPSPDDGKGAGTGLLTRPHVAEKWERVLAETIFILYDKCPSLTE